VTVNDRAVARSNRDPEAVADDPEGVVVLVPEIKKVSSRFRDDEDEVLRRGAWQPATRAPKATMKRRGALIGPPP